MGPVHAKTCFYENHNIDHDFGYERNKLLCRVADEIGTRSGVDTVN